MLSDPYTSSIGTLTDDLKSSIKRQAERLDRTLILSPTENIPLAKYALPDGICSLTNLYIPDYLRDKSAKLIFGGRDEATRDFLKIYDAWAKTLQAEEVSMRLLSGLHSHTLIFIGLKSIGNTVLVVPEEAGGHFATAQMLRNLGFNVIEMPVDYTNLEIDFAKTRTIIANEKIDFIFVDRSESLNYIDYSSLVADTNVYSIFDASHFLTNILVGDYKNPFDMGFDLCVATLHKSFPGPQKAIAFTKKRDSYWSAILETLRTYVSSVHPAGIYHAGLLLGDMNFLREYSRLTMKTSALLEDELAALGLPIVRRKPNLPDGYYIFLAINDIDKAYFIFNELLRCGIETNYRKLPYGLGQGIRMGTMATTVQGLRPENVNRLAGIISDIYYNGASGERAELVSEFLRDIKENKWTS